MRRFALLAGALAALVLAPSAWAASTSDVLRAPRPAQGEYFGLYLVNRKVGYVFNQVGPDPGHPDQVRSVTDVVMEANVGGQSVRREHIETALYEARPRGPLLRFVFEDRGDGGNQVLEGKVTAQGLHITRTRPGFPPDEFDRPMPKETVEDADPARVALLRHHAVNGYLLDASDLNEYPTQTTLRKTETRVIGGVKVRLHRVVTISQKDKIPLESWIADDGRLVELNTGQSMRAEAEPKSVAMRLDAVDLFKLTRVVLPNVLPQNIRSVPNQLSLVVKGLPANFQKDSYRQKFEALAEGRTQITLLARPPAEAALAHRPLKASQELAQYLESTPAIESTAPAIRTLAEKLVGSDPDAYDAAKKVVEWVYQNMQSSYGTSADRATEVLRQMAGDCTEHSLLTVALLRATGIPARRVDGLVYVRNSDGVPALYWHEWVEAYVGQWTQLDPTFGEDVADATHFALGEEANDEITPLLGELKVLEVR